VRTGARGSGSHGSRGPVDSALSRWSPIAPKGGGLGRGGLSLLRSRGGSPRAGETSGGRPVRGEGWGGNRPRRVDAPAGTRRLPCRSGLSQSDPPSVLLVRPRLGGGAGLGHEEAGGGLPWGLRPYAQGGAAVLDRLPGEGGKEDRPAVALPCTDPRLPRLLESPAGTEKKPPVRAGPLTAPDSAGGKGGVPVAVPCPDGREAEWPLRGVPVLPARPPSAPGRPDRPSLDTRARFEDLTPFC